MWHVRARHRPSRPVSMVGFVVGLCFVFLGVAVVIPQAGLFGIFWTFVAGAITLLHGYSLATGRALTGYEMEIEGPAKSENVSIPPDDFDVKLRKLAQLKADGLLSEEEFETKRAALLEQPW